MAGLVAPEDPNIQWIRLTEPIYRQVEGAHDRLVQREATSPPEM